MRKVHETCPPNGCDICQSDWPCARLSAFNDKESCASKLAAANKRIRELDKLAESISRDCNNTANERNSLRDQLTSERAVSDRLLEALKDARTDIDDWGAYAGEYFQEKWGLQEDLSRYDRLIAEVESIRKEHG